MSTTSLRAFESGKGLKILYGIALGAGLLLFAVSAYIVLRSNGSMPNLELSIFEAINSIPDTYKFLIIAITYLGSVWAFLAVGIIATIAKAYRLAWWLSLGMLVGGGLMAVLKRLIERPRPEGLTNDVIMRASESSFGFPSGHTTFATIIALTLFFYLPKGYRWIVVVFWIVSVAFSRIYLGVHSPLDVVGGFALGVIVVAGMRLLPDRIKRLLKLDAKTAPDEKPLEAKDNA